MSNKENNTDYSSNEELQQDYRKMVSDMRAMEIEQEDKELRRRESKLAILEFYKK